MNLLTLAIEITRMVVPNMRIAVAARSTADIGGGI